MLCTLWNIHNMEGYECKVRFSITQFFIKNMINKKVEWGKIACTYFCIDSLFSLVDLTIS
jgi:hypothetical protein